MDMEKIRLFKCHILEVAFEDFLIDVRTEGETNIKDNFEKSNSSILKISLSRFNSHLL